MGNKLIINYAKNQVVGYFLYFFHNLIVFMIWVKTFFYILNQLPFIEILFIITNNKNLITKI